MIKKIVLGVSLVLGLIFVSSSANALTFQIERNFYHGYSAPDFYHAVRVRPYYMAPSYAPVLPPYAHPYYSPVVPRYAPAYAPRGYHFHRRAYRY